MTSSPAHPANATWCRKTSSPPGRQQPPESEQRHAGQQERTAHRSVTASGRNRFHVAQAQAQPQERHRQHQPRDRSGRADGQQMPAVARRRSHRDKRAQGAERAHRHRDEVRQAGRRAEMPGGQIMAELVRGENRHQAGGEGQSIQQVPVHRGGPHRHLRAGKQTREHREDEERKRRPHTLLGVPEHHRQRQDLLAVPLLCAPQHRRAAERPHALRHQAIGGIRQHQEPAAQSDRVAGRHPLGDVPDIHHARGRREECGNIGRCDRYRLICCHR